MHLNVSLFSARICIFRLNIFHVTHFSWSLLSDVHFYTAMWNIILETRERECLSANPFAGKKTKTNAELIKSRPNFQALVNNFISKKNDLHFLDNRFYKLIRVTILNKLLCRVE